jgi:hypothetical protein
MAHSRKLPLHERVAGSEATETGHLLEGAGQGERRTLIGSHRYTPFDHFYPFERTGCHNLWLPDASTGKREGAEGELLLGGMPGQAREIGVQQNCVDGVGASSLPR